MRKSLILVGLTFLSSFATASDIEELTVTARRLSSDLLHVSQLELQREFDQEVRELLSVVHKPMLPEVDYKINFEIKQFWVEKTDDHDDEKSEKTSS